MSFEYLCQHCGKGLVRPIQFSFDEAVVTCDNEDCESRLDVSPWSCVVNRNIRQVYIPASNQRLIQHWSRSSSSSSGIQSDVRSPGFSPARSYDSVTDREVENLLQRYINARPKIAKEMAQSCSKPNSEKVKADDLNSFSSFFELLDGLDLEGSDQTSGKEGPLRTAPAACDEVKFDPVSSELESWMKGFESPMSSIKKDPGEDFGADPAESAEIKDSISNRLYIPSRGSAFSQVSPKNDSVQSSSSCSLVDSDAVIAEKNQESTVTAIDKAFDVAKNCTPSFSEAQFLSPATSTVSEDSGYDESGSKINSVLFLPSLEKRNNQSCAIPDPDKNTTCKKNKFSKASRSCEENSESDPVMQSNIVSTTASSGPCTQLSQLESVVMNDVGSLNTSKEQSGNQSDQMGQDDEKQAVNSSGTSFESSQFSDSISPSETKSSVASADTNNSNASTLQESSSNSSSSLQSKESELYVKPPTKKSGRPRGRPRKHPEVELPKRENKRRRVTTRKEEISRSSASLSKGLASVLQTPSFYVRKEEVRHHNITTLNFRNRLNGTFVQDPWSVPELNLEELCIEIVVQGQREPPSSQKESRVNVASNEETKTTDPCKLDRDARKEALFLENKETDNTLCVSNTSDVERLKSSTGNIGQSSLEDLKSQVKVSCDVIGHESSDIESEESSSSDGLNESCTTKDGETDVTVNLLVPDRGSRTGTSNALDSSSVQRLKQLHTDDEGLSISEKNQQPCVSVEREKQTCRKFCDGASCCSSADTRARVKTEENTCDLSSEKKGDCSKTPKMDTSVTRCCIKDDNLSCDESKTHIRNKSIDLLDVPQAVSPSLLDVKGASHWSELSSLKVSESPMNSLLDTSFDPSLSILYETDSCMLDFASSPNIRSWMRCKESKPVVIKKEKIDTDVSETSLSYSAEKKIRSQSSDYFNTLLEDLDFEEEFFQCPTTENLSTTFGEHLSSSLFFGETACSSVATSVEGTPVNGSSASVCTSVLDLSSVSTTVTTVMSPTSKLGLNFSCSSKSTNGTVPLSGVSTAISMRAIPSAVSSSATRVTHSLHRAITSIQDISSLPSACGTSENKICSDRVLDRGISRGKDVCNPYNKKLVSDTNLLVKNLQGEQENSKGLWNQNDCEKGRVLKEEVLHEPTSNEYSSIEKTGNSCKNKASTCAASVLETPFISIDSDDEIQIIMPKEKSLTEKSKSTISTVRNDVTAEVRQASQFNRLSSVSSSLEHPSILPLGVSSETSQKEVVKDGRLKELSISQGAQETDGKHLVHKVDAGQDSSSIQENNLMCGIMDNSVVHDPSCFSPNAKGFVEFKEDSLSEAPPPKIKFYFGLKKTDFTLCKDLQVSYTSKSNTSQEQLDNITLEDKHLGSPDGASLPFSFEVGSNFGCTKSSPQHKILMSPTSDDSSVGVMDVDANNVSFLCYGSSSETCSSSSSSDDDDEMEYDSRDVRDSKMFSSLTKNFALNVAKEVTPSNSTDLSTSGVYDESGEESESDQEAIIRRRILLNKGVLRTGTSDSDSHIFKKPLPCFKRKLDFDYTSESESQSEFEEQSSPLIKSPFYVPVMPLKKEATTLHKLSMETYENLLSAPKIAKKASSALHKPSVQSSEKLLLPPKFPLHNKFSSVKNSCAGNVPVHSTQKQIFILNKSSLSKEALRNAEPSQEKDPLCLSKGEKYQKTPFQTSLLQSPNSSSPLSHRGNQKPSHHPFQKHTMPCRTSIEKPLLCHSLPSSSTSPLPSTNTDSVASPMTSLKIHSVIDCQMPSVTNPSVIIPPALRSSYAPVQECMQNVSKDVGSSNKVNNMQEKLIVLKNETPNGPVMKVLRVNVIPNNKLGSPLTAGVSGPGTHQPSVSQAPKPKVNVAKPVVTCALTANPSVSHVSNDSLEGIRSNCSKRKEIPKDLSSEGTKKQLITKIKVGDNERYYVRPTFTMMKAISEMRKNKDQDTPNDDTEVDCVELPDGVPISHPLHIPDERSLKRWYKVHNNRMLARSKKRRKRKKKYILQKIQNLVKEKVQETVRRSRDEIPEMVAVFIGGKLHIYSRDTDRQSAQ
ncbi:serine-rich adhesin for platelets-like isoform X2 [Macrobrachium rosenbergii]|uniref:serine-rich adhesin for platelets-like isoform X2 n=1 Tax=Macrobrachium rosenbergii TaxID=79674 RepID=UPI0034D6F424